MPLAVQGPRPLSPLEEEAVDFVFQRQPPAGVEPTEIVSEIQLEIVEHIPRYIKPWLRVVPSTYDGNGIITISSSAFPHAQALNKDSTRKFLGSTDRWGERIEPFRPGNMHYLSTVIFECAHHWQEKYNLYRNPGYPGDPPYHFNQEQLKDLRLFSEQHASAAQIYFLIQWQMRYKGFPINLTSQPSNSERSVGPVDRYTRIPSEFQLEDGRRIFEEGDKESVQSLQADFVNYERNLWDRGEETPCKKSTQPTQIDERSQFYRPLGPQIPQGGPKVPEGAIALRGGGWIDPKKLLGGGP